MHRLFVDVGYELSEHQLRQYFTNYGAVSDVYLPKHSMGRNKGYAFVTFGSEHALSTALSDTQPVVNGIKLKVKRATPRPPGKTEQVASPKTPVSGAPSAHIAKLLIEGLAAGVTEAKVQQHFAKWGPVSAVSLCPTQHGQDCVVTFVNHIDAKRACDQSERVLAGWAVKSIRPVTQDNIEQHRSLSPKSEASHVISNQSQLGNAFSEVSQTYHLPLGMPDVAQAQLVVHLRATNPSAFAAWLHLERVQQQLLAEHLPAMAAAQLHIQAHNAVYDQANAGHIPSPAYVPHASTPAGCVYNAPYCEAGHPAVSSPSQQYADSVLSQLYSQSDQQSSGQPSLYSQSGQPSAPMADAYIQSHPPPATKYEAALPFSQALGAAAPGLQRSQSGSLNYLSTLTQQAMAAAGFSGGAGGYMDGTHQAEADVSGVPMQDQVQSKYSLPNWSPL